MAEDLLQFFFLEFKLVQSFGQFEDLIGFGLNFRLQILDVGISCLNFFLCQGNFLPQGVSFPDQFGFFLSLFIHFLAVGDDDRSKGFVLIDLFEVKSILTLEIGHVG